MAGGSRHHIARTGVGQVGTPRWHILPCRLRLRSGAQHLCLPRRRRTDQHRQYRSRQHRLLQGKQGRLLALFIEAEMNDGDRAQNHPRPQRRCAGSCPCVGQYGSLQQSRRERKKVEMRFAHMQRILRLDRLRLRGLSGVRDEVPLTATAQNLRRLASFTSVLRHL
jgi:hypothetical protein